MSSLRYPAAVLCALGIAVGASAQNLRNYYVSKSEQDGTIYHTLPATLFEHREAGDLTFDITYKEHQEGMATINFTYENGQAMPIDSVRFISGKILLAGPATKIYIEPVKKQWKHRYSFRTPMAPLCSFFDAAQSPTVELYTAKGVIRYRAKRSAWRSYAPMGYKIFETIRINELP